MFNGRRVKNSWTLYLVFVVFCIWTIYDFSKLHPVQKIRPKTNNELMEDSSINNIILNEEAIISNNDFSVRMKSTQFGGRAIVNSQIIDIGVSRLNNNEGRSLQYVLVPIKKSLVYMQKEAASSLVEGNNELKNRGDNVKNYFHSLRHMTGKCSKLVRLGGFFTCKNTSDERNLDGNKLVCLDPEMQIGGKVGKEKCLVLSFGVNVDTSFDEVINDAHCEVHMFDIFNYTKPYFDNITDLNFHKIALGTQRHSKRYLAYNLTLEFYSFNDVVVEFALSKRLINVLKIDIEGQEWTVLEDMIKEPYMSVIGQIAIEVHAMDLLKANATEIQSISKRQHNCILSLEKIGFRRVAYWDNNQPKYKYTGQDGTKYDTAGELLLVNSNWYKHEFRKSLVEFDYEFL